jgi:hypothetical protein
MGVHKSYKDSKPLCYHLPNLQQTLFSSNLFQTTISVDPVQPHGLEEVSALPYFYIFI